MTFASINVLKRSSEGLFVALTMNVCLRSPLFMQKVLKLKAECRVMREPSRFIVSVSSPEEGQVDLPLYSFEQARKVLDSLVSYAVDQVIL